MRMISILIIFSREDIDFLLEKTSFDEYDIREWFRAFIKVMASDSAVDDYSLAIILMMTMTLMMMMMMMMMMTMFHLFRIAQVEASQKQRRQGSTA